MYHNLLTLDFMQEDKNSIESLDDALAVASTGVALLKAIEELLAGTSQNVQSQLQELMGHSLSLINAAGVQGTLLSRLLLKETGDEKQAILIKKEATAAGESIAGITTDMLTTLQFEDRHTQLMADVTGILERYRSQLESLCLKIAVRQELSDNSGKIHDCIDAVITSGIRLQEVRSCCKKPSLASHAMQCSTPQ